ncbi:uncharacterized protein [Montipora foliosa]|uniref:uncharacterized protein n=1 Tax=Montipora foliosa TaxID=591990 RepID=UPI0035F10AF7
MLRTFFLVTFVAFFAIIFEASGHSTQSHKFVTEDKLGRELYHLTHKFDKKISEAKRDMRDTVGKTIGDAEKRLKTMVTEVTGKLQLEMKGLTRRINGARVECTSKETPFDLQSDKPIMFLARQNVECPTAYFLAQFALRRKGDYNSAPARYIYRCCKFVL